MELALRSLGRGISIGAAPNWYNLGKGRIDIGLECVRPLLDVLVIAPTKQVIGNVILRCRTECLLKPLLVCLLCLCQCFNFKQFGRTLEEQIDQRANQVPFCNACRLSSSGRSSFWRYSP